MVTLQANLRVQFDQNNRVSLTTTVTELRGAFDHKKRQRYRAILTTGSTVRHLQYRAPSHSATSHCTEDRLPPYTLSVLHQAQYTTSTAPSTIRNLSTAHGVGAYRPSLRCASLLRSAAPCACHTLAQYRTTHTTIH
eukprot:1837108-Rhodomonas_salina.1